MSDGIGKGLGCRGRMSLFDLDHTEQILNSPIMGISARRIRDKVRASSS